MDRRRLLQKEWSNQKMECLTKLSCSIRHQALISLPENCIISSPALTGDLAREMSDLNVLGGWYLITRSNRTEDIAVWFRRYPNNNLNQFSKELTSNIRVPTHKYHPITWNIYGMSDDKTIIVSIDYLSPKLAS